MRASVPTLCFTALWAVGGLPGPRPHDLSAQEEPAAPIAARVDRLERQVEELRRSLDADSASTDLDLVKKQIDAITRELEEIRLGEAITARADTTAFGLGPAASKVYRTGQGVSIGGYGEFLYQGFAAERQDGSPAGAADRIDALRAVFYFGYKFDDHFLFNSEIELEHGTTSESGSASVEFAYLDYRFRGLSGSTGLRAGLVLLPMGFINELHEPPTFLGTARPESERKIIPSTWREIGLGGFGSAGSLSWRAYLVSGLDAVGGGPEGGGFTATGLRGGRQKGSRALAEDFALVGRADWTGFPGLRIGTSAYYGSAGQGNADPLETGRTLAAGTFIWEGHAGYRAHGLDLRGLFALATVDDVASLNAANGLSGPESIGERLIGWYLQVGYDVLRSVRTDVRLVPYVRFESLNTQDEVPDGFTSDPATDRELLTVGAQVLPIPNVSLKADYTFESTGDDRGVNHLNVSLGYLF